jgi:hypothetical protein
VEAAIRPEHADDLGGEPTNPMLKLVDLEP